MQRLPRWGAMGLAAVLLAGCENTATMTGATVPRGENGESAVTKMTIVSAAQQTIKRGDSDEVSITIDRENFNAPITIRLDDLPRGVVCVEDEVVVPPGETQVTLTLKAAPDAAVGNFKVKIDAQAPGIDDNVRFFKLNVI